MKIHSLAVLAFITSSVGTTGAQEVVNPCNICPNGATAGDDVAPYAEYGDPITCKELIKAAKLFKTGTYWCSIYEMTGTHCCPPSGQPQDPCPFSCPNGITVTDEIHTDYGCYDLVRVVSMWDSKSDVCKDAGKGFESMCCPTVAENPCVICPDGATAGDDFIPFEDSGDLMTCKEYIEMHATFEAGSDLCFGGEVEALCCPSPSAPETPCNICPGGATAGDGFLPFSAHSTCGELMAEAEFFRKSSENCKHYEGYEVSCYPDAVASNAALGGATLSGFDGFTFVAVASALWSFHFV
jgi:hypothetical protein